MGKRFSINEEPEYGKVSGTRGEEKTEEAKALKQKETRDTRRCLSDKMKRFSDEGLTGMLFIFWMFRGKRTEGVGGNSRAAFVWRFLLLILRCLYCKRSGLDFDSVESVPKNNFLCYDHMTLLSPQKNSCLTVMMEQGFVHK